PVRCRPCCAAGARSRPSGGRSGRRWRSAARRRTPAGGARRRRRPRRSRRWTRTPRRPCAPGRWPAAVARWGRVGSARRAERLGPVVACGAGGGTAEVLGDVGVRLAPLAREDALETIRGLRSQRLLEREGADVGALADIAVRVGALADAHPAIAELDLNPVM